MFEALFKRLGVAGLLSPAIVLDTMYIMLINKFKQSSQLTSKLTVGALASVKDAPRAIKPLP